VAPTPPQPLAIVGGGTLVAYFAAALAFLWQHQP
jgi:hypothetical protein